MSSKHLEDLRGILGGRPPPHGPERRLPGHAICTTKSYVIVQSTLLTPITNCFARALPLRGSRDPLRLAEGGALPYRGEAVPAWTRTTTLSGPRLWFRVWVWGSWLRVQGLDLSGTEDYEPEICALFGTASHFWKDSSCGSMRGPTRRVSPHGVCAKLPRNPGRNGGEALRPA